MTITLTIDSLDRLPDGGPVRYQARNRGFEIGRQNHLDWTLPDPSRYISGVHCDVRFEKGGYWLYDVSRNGTFLNGSTSRMKSPHLLTHGDRLSVGHYTIGVEIADGAAQSPGAPDFRVEAPPEPVYGAPSDDIWDTGAPAPPPIDRRDLIPEPPGRRRAADFSDQFIDLPDMRPAAVPAPRQTAPDPFATPESEAFAYRSAPAPQATPVDPFATDDQSAFAYRSEPLPVSSPAPAVPPPQPVSQPYRQAPAEPPIARGRAMPVDSGESFAPFQPDGSAAPAAAHSFARASGAASQASQRFLEGLAAGAGVPAEIFSTRDPAEMGFEVGEFLKVTVEQLAQLLRARAAAKAMTKSSSRTMIGATDNNPLKFIPLPAEIIEVMFTRKRPGYLGGRAALEAGFGDLKRHELATWTAMQKALARLLDDFSPETIEAKAGSSVLSSKKSRSWELFVERWESKTQENENGMLDVFLGYFAEAYDEASRKG